MPADSTGGPIQSAPSQHVKMQVRHGLPPVPADVGDDSIAVTGKVQGPGRFTRRKKEVAGEPLVLRSKMVRRDHMALGNHQKVGGSLGVHVPEDECPVVVMDDLGGYLTGDDSTEDAVIGHEGDLLDQWTATGVMGPSPTPDRPEFAEWAHPSM